MPVPTVCVLMTNETPNTVTEPPERRSKSPLRCALITSIALILLTAPPASSLAARYRLHQAQLSALAELNARGGMVSYEELGPLWLRNLLGKRFDFLFRRERSFYVCHPNSIRDEHLQCLADFPRLESVNLVEADVTDAGLLHLTTLRELETLHLARTKVTDEFMPRLGAFQNLSSLDLSETNVSLQGLGHLEGIGSLRLLLVDFAPFVPSEHECPTELAELQRANRHLSIKRGWTLIFGCTCWTGPTKK